jgi:hypothetical protein
MLAAIALMNVITGLAAAVVLAPISFGLDADAFRRGAAAVTEGRMDVDFLYTPLAALLAQPLTWIPPIVAGLVMTCVGLTVLLVGVAVETRGLAPVDRMLVGVAAVFFIPVVNELLLGQITVLLAAALYPIVRGSDRVRNGIPLGLAVALAPKPLIVPVIGWMLVWRRRSLLGVASTAAATTLVGIALMGTDLYGLWIDVLTGTSRAARHGNVSLWPSAGIRPEAILAALAVALAALWTIVRSEGRGLVAALLAGLLLAPYTLVYAATILLLAVRPAMGYAPRALRLLALAANPAMVFAFVPWVITALVITLPINRRSRQTSTGFDDPVVPGTGRPRAT